MANTRRLKVAKVRSLGDFTPAAEARQEATFDYHGTWRLNPGLSELSFVDWMEAADQVDEKDVRNVTMIKGFVREFVHVDDFDQFWAACRANGRNTSDLLALVMQLTEAATGRPTKRRPGSSGGRGTTAAKSTESSSDPALDHLAGRPDLQLMVVRARRDRRAA